MDNSFKNKKNDPKFWKTIKDDWKKTQVRRTIKQDWRELRDFYLSTEQKKKLENMNRFKRWFVVSWWLLKGMFFKLTPMRRLLLLISMFLIFSVTTSINSKDNTGYTNPIPAYLVITFILMLELKDKLLAHSELQEGKSVQIALLPDENPDIPGWDCWLFTRPANDVGGDLVDFMQLSENKYYLALGDVAGKGMGAALLMAKLQSTLRAIAQDFKSLEELGNKINKIFHRDSLPNKFASLVYLETEANNGKIRMLNAGHFQPLILKNNEIIETEKGAPAIGIMNDTKYTEQEFNLKKDDILFVYSDGLIEACNEKNEFYGEIKLQEILQETKHLPCNEIGKKIMLSVDGFVGDATLHDDLSMIIMKKN
jgi:hypothetical protein